MLSNNIQKLNMDPRRDAYSASQHYVKLKDLENIIHVFGANCEHLTLCLESHHTIENLVLTFMQKLSSLSAN